MNNGNQKKRGFSLIELMIVVSIISILSIIAVPAYQMYTKKAALTELLHAILPYKMSVELCGLTQPSSKNEFPKECQSGTHGIPGKLQTTGEHPGYLKTVEVGEQGVITVVGRELLEGLVITLRPEWISSENIVWKKSCESADTDLVNACQAVFRFQEV